MFRRKELSQRCKDKTQKANTMRYREQSVTTTTAEHILAVRRTQNDFLENHEEKTTRQINSRERKRKKFKSLDREHINRVQYDRS
jgi:hypothetical protein